MSGYHNAVAELELVKAQRNHIAAKYVVNRDALLQQIYVVLTEIAREQGVLEFKAASGLQ